MSDRKRIEELEAELAKEKKRADDAELNSSWLPQAEETIKTLRAALKQKDIELVRKDKALRGLTTLHLVFGGMIVDAGVKSEAWVKMFTKTFLSNPPAKDPRDVALRDCIETFESELNLSSLGKLLNVKYITRKLPEWKAVLSNPPAKEAKGECQAKYHMDQDHDHCQQGKPAKDQEAKR